MHRNKAPRTLSLELSASAFYYVHSYPLRVTFLEVKVHMHIQKASNQKHTFAILTITFKYDSKHIDLYIVLSA